jgi:hypothetical protein
MSDDTPETPAEPAKPDPITTWAGTDTESVLAMFGKLGLDPAPSSTFFLDEERKDVPQVVQCCPWHSDLMLVIEIAYAWINDGKNRGKRVPYAIIRCKRRDCGAEKQAWGQPGDALEPLLGDVIKAWNR